MKSSLQVIALFLIFTLALSPFAAVAQGYPNKPIRFVVGYPPGGATDTLTRIVAQKMTERFNHPVMVVNKAGANSIIAADYVAKSAPDGYTMLVNGPGLMSSNPGDNDRLPYDPAKDFVPITLFASDPLVFAVNPSLPVNSLKELIAMAKDQPGKLSYGEGAPPMYVAAELFKKLAGVDIVHIPYKGSGPSIMAAVTGEVPLVVVSIGPALAQLRAGKLRPLAVTAAKRASHLPNVPTVKEAAGLDFEGGVWLGLFAPAGTPRAITDKLYGELAIVLKSDSVKERLSSLGYDTDGSGMTPAEFDAFFQTNLAKWINVTKDLHIGTY